MYSESTDFGPRAWAREPFRLRVSKGVRDLSIGTVHANGVL